MRWAVLVFVIVVMGAGFCLGHRSWSYYRKTAEISLCEARLNELSAHMRMKDLESRHDWLRRRIQGYDDLTGVKDERNLRRYSEAELERMRYEAEAIHRQFLISIYDHGRALNEVSRAELRLEWYNFR